MPSLLRRAPNVSRVPGVVHGFTSRRGGVSEGGLGSLNLALRADERPERLAENWSRVLAELAVPGVTLLEQVHGAEVLEVTRATGPLATAGRADAAFTTVPGLALGVRVADCVPVLLAGPGVVGVVHAGWRGVAAGVVGIAIRAIADRTGVAAGALVAAVGPCISGPAYEVGDEVVAGLRAAGLPDAAFLAGASPRGRALVDLRRAVDHQLAAAGVVDRWIDERCTAIDPDLYSHRRDGDGAGRFAGVIARIA